MKKNFKKSKFVILPALATLVLTGVASVTGTVAWFTANRAVTVKGMQLKAQASSNLLVTASETNATTKANDSDFKSSLTWTNTTVSELIPSSTVDAKSYFKANADIVGDGSVNSSAAAKYIIVETSDVAYVDFTIQLKAINVKTDDCNIYVKSLDLHYGNDNTGWSGSDGKNAFRVAFFTEKYTTAFTSGVATTSTAIIYKPSAGENFTKGQAVGTIEGLTTVSYVEKATSLTSVTKSSTEYFKTIVRVWLEGEDKHCTNDLFKDSTENWSLDLGLELGDKKDETGSVTSIAVSGTNPATPAE